MINRTVGEPGEHGGSGARLFVQAISGLANCHHVGLNSVVLKQRPDGSLRRIFHATAAHRMDRLFTGEGHFTVGAHNHDKELQFRVLFGEVWNVRVEIATGSCGVTLFRYPFGSALERGSFSLGEPIQGGYRISLEPINGLWMGIRDIHTVLVGTTTAAWEVDEGPPQQVQKYIYSPRPDLKLESDGLYVPMSDTDLARECAAIDAAYSSPQAPTDGAQGGQK